MITKDEYKNITGCYPYDGFYLPKVSIEEVQQFLEGLGYTISIYKAPWAKRIGTSIPGTGEVELSESTHEFYDPRIIALKLGETPPERNDSEDAIAKDFIAVFNKEIKKKLLGI